MVYTANTVTNQLCQYSYLNGLCVEIRQYPLLSPSSLCFVDKTCTFCLTRQKCHSHNHSLTVCHRLHSQHSTNMSRKPTRHESHVAALAVTDSQVQNTPHTVTGVLSADLFLKRQRFSNFLPTVEKQVKAQQAK